MTKARWILCGILVLMALGFKFLMRGYDYIAYALLFICVLVIVFSAGAPWLRRAVLILTCLGLGYFCSVEWLILSAARNGQEEPRDYLIVLGAAVHGDEPSLSLMNRLDGALDYLEKFPDTTVIVSGGQGDGENISEARCMSDYLMEHGVDPAQIRMEDRSTSTLENLRFSKALIEQEGGDVNSVAVVSSGYHLYRAGLMARSVGLGAVGVKGHRGYPVYTVGMYIREAFGVTHLWVLGY